MKEEAVIIASLLLRLNRLNRLNCLNRLNRLNGLNSLDSCRLERWRCLVLYVN